MTNTIINQDGAEERLGHGVVFCNKGNQEDGLRFIQEGLKWFEDNNVELPLGSHYTVGLALNNVKDKNGDRIPEWQDKAIILMERIASKPDWVERVRNHMGNDATELFFKILDAAKGEQKYRN
jgi:hypothetical protein